MINPELPMFDSDGREWVALRLPDGSVFYPEENTFLATRLDLVRRFYTMSGRSECRETQLTNTKPHKDWSGILFFQSPPQGHKRSLMEVKVRAGYRNGKPFAEVVDESLPT